MMFPENQKDLFKTFCSKPSIRLFFMLANCRRKIITVIILLAKLQEEIFAFLFFPAICRR